MYMQRGNFKGVKLRTFCAISEIDNHKYLPQLSAVNYNIYTHVYSNRVYAVGK